MWRFLCSPSIRAIHSVRDWLNKPEVLSDYANWDEIQALKNLGFSEEEIEQMLKERMLEQNEEHNGGNYWVGTHWRCGDFCGAPPSEPSTR